MASPIPETFFKSSIKVNGPFNFRYAKIRFAITGPMPGKVSNCESVAEFKLSGLAAVGAYALAGLPEFEEYETLGAPTIICSPSNKI